MKPFQPHQAFTNTVAKQASSGELNRWRQAGVDPELLQFIAPHLTTTVQLEQANSLLETPPTPEPDTVAEA